MPVNGLAAAQTMLDFATWRPGYCLEAVWQAFKRNGARTDRSAPTAYVGWQNSDDKHPGDRNPPPGVPVWWGPKASSSAGDVVISLGGGRVVATDWPHNGVIGITTIDARQRQIGRPYLGWTGDILGADIAYSTPAGGGSTPAPTTPKEWDEMATRAEVKSAVLEALASRPDAKIVSFSGEDRNGIYLAAPGHWHQFTAEEWKQFSDHGLRSGIGDLIPVNARDFDVLKAIYAPSAAPAPAVLTDDQLQVIVAQIKQETSADLDDVDLDRIAKAVRAQFAADPLK